MHHAAYSGTSPAQRRGVVISKTETTTPSSKNEKREHMTVSISITGILLALGIPSAVTGFSIWLLQRSITKRDAAKDKVQEKRDQEQHAKDEARAELEILTIQGNNAAIALSEAVAHALQRGHTNGDTESALSYAAEVKHKQKDFLTRQGVNAVLSE